MTAGPQEAVFFRVNYSFADRYLLEVNGRYDLSSKFPKDDRSVFSPSFSLGWKLSEESWFKQPTNGFFDELKIRASYGSLANQALDNGWYAYLSNYGTGTLGYIMGGETAPIRIARWSCKQYRYLGKRLPSGTWDLTLSSCRTV